MNIVEMGGIYFKNGDARKGGNVVVIKAKDCYCVDVLSFDSYLHVLLSGVFSKAAKAIRESPAEITTKKEAMALKGVGKGIATYMEEFFESGVITRLEEMRAGQA